MTNNTPYYGDNLEILREHVPDESVDLVCLHTLLNSNASCNVLFREQTGPHSLSQLSGTCAALSLLQTGRNTLS